MNEIKAVLLDAEGTFVHIHPSVGHVYAYVLSKHGYNYNPLVINRAFSKIWSKAKTKRKKAISREANLLFWKEIFLETTSIFAELEDQDAIFMECYKEFSKTRWWRLAEGLVETLEQWKSEDLRIGIVSNWDERLDELINGFGIWKYFDSITISTEVGIEKPNPKIIELTCSNLGVSPSQAVMIGDSPDLDHAAALAAGCYSILYDPYGNLSGSYCCITDFKAVGCKEKLKKVIEGSC